ncbi:MAG: non-canonical purine NTP phosphatase [bacterium]|nr:non-canonical purine NTP phosphatase [bacterium]
MKRLFVASRNPVKARAVELGFQRMFPGQAHELRAVSVDSDVSDQPASSSETLRGAANRAAAARAAAPDADFWIGIEGGIEDSDLGMAAFAWVVVMSSDRKGQGKTATFFLPEEVADMVRGGMELGHADDVVFGRENSKQKDGAIGLLTDNVVDRAALYEQGVIMAFVPFKNDRLYG